jgi:flagellar protein FliJ
MEAATLTTLIELATTSRDAAATRLARCERTLGMVRASLERLRGYATDYGGRARDQRQRGFDIAAELNQRAFDAKLNHALEAQLREVELHQRQVDAASAELAQCERKLRSLDKLAQRRAAELLQLEATREQKLNDEIASRASAAYPIDSEGMQR